MRLHNKAMPLTESGRAYIKSQKPPNPVMLAAKRKAEMISVKSC